MRNSLIRLTSSQLVVVAAGIGTVLAVVWIAFMPALEEVYIRELALPSIEQRYGFRYGTVRFTRDTVAYEWAGIVSLTPNGELARLGLRLHDVPFAHHGNGGTVFYRALIAGERGERASFDVVNADDWSAGRDQQAFRTIRVQPRSAPR